MSADKRYVATWPTYPVPTPLRDDDGEVVTFPTRREAVRYAEEREVPYPADNVWLYKGDEEWANRHSAA